MERIMTPNEHNRRWKGLKETRKDLRQQIARIRDLRSSAKFLDKEEGENATEYLRFNLHIYRREMKVWVTAKVEKYSNLSPNAAKKEAMRRGGSDA